MATKKELLQTLAEADVEGFTASDDKSDLEEAVDDIRKKIHDTRDERANRQKGV